MFLRPTLCALATLFGTVCCLVLQPDEWDVLAPFPGGTRELGADPLVRYGGIFNIPRADSTTYPSELVNGGLVGWQKAYTNTTTGWTALYWNSSFVNWDLLEGWAGLAVDTFGGWAIGDVTVSSFEAGLYSCLCMGVERYYIDSPSSVYVGDQYGEQLAYQAVNFTAGTHTLYLNLFPGSTSCIGQPPFIVQDTIVPDLLSYGISPYYLSSSYASVTIMSAIPSPNYTIDFHLPDWSGLYISNFLTSFPLPSGQIVRVQFELKVNTSAPILNCSGHWSTILSITVSSYPHSTTMIPLVFNCITWGNPYSFTFLDQDKSVQLAAAWPPVQNCSTDGCPVLLTLHGAGVANSPAWTNGSYVRQNNTWILFPTNRRPYGYDWQGPGFLNVWTSLYALTTMPGVPPQLQNVLKPNVSRLIYAGHSMGGHGCWLVSTHFPDQPYFLQLGRSRLEPWAVHIMEQTQGEWDADLYMTNMKGIPLLIRMGSDDDNVPPYHLRRMSRLLDEEQFNPSYTEISEIPNEGHWFNGVVDDAIMQAFFNNHSAGPLPTLPTSFTLQTMHPFSFESRGGISVLQFQVPYHMARIQVSAPLSGQWTLTAVNVRRFGFVPVPGMRFPSAGIIIDGKSFLAPPLLPKYHFCNLADSWEVCADDQWQTRERSGATYGPIYQVTYSGASIMIVYGTQGSTTDTASRQQAALYIANSLYYQGNFAPLLLPDSAVDIAAAQNSNLILLGGPCTNSVARQLTRSPVRFHSDCTFSIGPFNYSFPGTGVIFLSPWGSERLAVVLEGIDDAGFWQSQTPYLFPKKSGTEIADWLVVGPRFGYSGLYGAAGMGFWDNFWNYSPLLSFTDPLYTSA